MIKQDLLFENRKTYDKLEVNVVMNKNGKLCQQTENYFFVITNDLVSKNKLNQIKIRH
jgi:hypothetical protein